MPRRRKAELVAASMLSPSVRGLVFRTADGSAVGNRPGQYVDVIVPVAGGIPQRRAYSIASAALDTFEIAVTRVEGGPASEALHALPLGGRVEVEGPEGNFLRHEGDRAAPALFVATGTGLAPIRAMLAEETRATQGPPLVLLFGCRTPGDFLWGDELRAWERTCPRLRVEVTFSRPPPDWAGRSGHVQRHVLALAAELAGAHAYVCGLSAMVDDVVKLLGERGGIPREALHYEVYD
jgi:ferredoxin-NADP reductase